MAKRDNVVNLVAGRRGSGKTDFSKEEIIAPSQLPKTLIVDTFDNPPWRTMKTWKHPEWQTVPINIIRPEMFQGWESGIYRVFSSNPKDLFKFIQESIMNCNVIIEDATRFIKRATDEELMNFVWDSKQKNVDLTFNFHFLNAIPNDLIQAADTLTIFETKDTKEQIKNKFSDPDVLLLAQHLQRPEKVKYEHYTIKF